MSKDLLRRTSVAIKECGLSFKTLSEHLGCSYQAVRNWAAMEREPNIETLKKIAHFTKVDFNWLLTGDGSRYGTEVLDGNLVSIRVLDVRASAGLGEMIFEDDQIIDRIDIDKSWLKGKCSYSHPSKLSIITASGDSMEPTISHGDMLLVDQGVNSIRSDSIYVAAINDNVYVKRFQITPRNTILMLSDNPRYKEFEVNPEQDRLRIIGKIIYHWHGQAR